MNRRETKSDNSSNAGHVNTTTKVVQSKPIPIWRNTIKYNHQAQHKFEPFVPLTNVSSPKKWTKPTTTTTSPVSLRSNSIASTSSPVYFRGAQNSLIANKRSPILPITVNKQSPIVPNNIRTTRIGVVADKRFQKSTLTQGKGSAETSSGRGITGASGKINVILPPQTVKSNTKSLIDSQMFPEALIMTSLADGHDTTTPHPHTQIRSELITFNVQVENQNANDLLKSFCEDKTKEEKEEKDQLLAMSNEEYRCIINLEPDDSTTATDGTVKDSDSIFPNVSLTEPTIIVQVPSQDKIDSLPNVIEEQENTEIPENADTLKEQSESLHSCDQIALKESTNKCQEEKTQDDQVIVAQEEPEIATQDAQDAVIKECDKCQGEKPQDNQETIIIKQKLPMQDDNEDVSIESDLANQEIYFISSPIFVSQNQESLDALEGENENESSTNQTNVDTEKLIMDTVQDAEETIETDSKTDIDKYVDQLMDIENETLTSDTEKKILTVQLDDDKSAADSKSEEETCLCFNLVQGSSTSMTEVEESTPVNLISDQDVVRPSSRGTKKLKRTMFSI